MKLLKLFESLTEHQQVHKDKLKQALTAYMPEQALDLCAELIMFYRLHLHIEVERKGRYGDYTPHSGKGSRISVNHNLSPYEFLITFVHELGAPYYAPKNTDINTMHMGLSGKNEFKLCMRPFFLIWMSFPYDVKSALAKAYAKTPNIRNLQM
jgi:SprT protein